MSGKQIMASIFGMAFRVTVIGIGIMIVYKLAITSYGFGYNLFADTPMESPPGREVTVVIPQGTESAYEIGKILEEKELIESAILFWAQEMISDYKGRLQSGNYELNTSMSSKEMMAAMAKPNEEEQ